MLSGFIDPVIVQITMQHILQSFKRTQELASESPLHLLTIRVGIRRRPHSTRRRMRNTVTEQSAKRKSSTGVILGTKRYLSGTRPRF